MPPIVDWIMVTSRLPRRYDFFWGIDAKGRTDLVFYMGDCWVGHRSEGNFDVVGWAELEYPT